MIPLCVCLFPAGLLFYSGSRITWIDGVYLSSRRSQCIHTQPTVEYYKIYQKGKKENKERRRRRRRLSKTGRSAFSQRILPLDRPAIDSLTKTFDKMHRQIKRLSMEVGVYCAPKQVFQCNPSAKRYHFQASMHPRIAEKHH